MFISKVHNSSTETNLVPGDKIITPGAIVQLVFTARLATEKDIQSPTTEKSTTETLKDDSDVDEDDVDILIGRKKAHRDGDPEPIPLAHAPYFPIVIPLFTRLRSGTQAVLVHISI
jgi:hypothetical protein